MESLDAEFEVFLIRFDCVAPSKSRLKLYIIDPHVRLEDIRALWTLGGQQRDPVTLKGLGIAEKLWNIFGFHDMECPTTDVDRLPMAAYYEMKPGKSTPKPQLYLPLHGRNDEVIADALTEFFRYLEWEGYACRYKPDLISNL
ncbi:uncharacterized protein ATNIH1004_000999 [Aspergillus tanneri]|uniref:Uncharacterized protein n=1 Tax=Aspergillus tanneri TaxID=1220188 RepID=A0A5M9MYC2_9EURO|nr:uncharacterized protein ATNIH1004_000999 [Aspergillus tanneri]KAA8652095.1 hypothetical protein ATNIH1004_000999 [Aspergillus tanneri]